jgi:ASC-1-like (ASCH) protein
MDHLAIMKKSWGLTEKILNGEKIIESRWYSSKRAPWNRIKKGEIVYFKDSGDPVSVKAIVRNVLQFPDLTPKKVGEILKEYGDADGLDKEKIPEFYQRFKDKKYCILVFLKNPQKIKPFKINKAGFGMMSAWITVENISDIKRQTD